MKFKILVLRLLTQILANTMAIKKSVGIDSNMESVKYRMYQEDLLRSAKCAVEEMGSVDCDY